MVSKIKKDGERSYKCAKPLTIDRLDDRRHA